MDRVEQGYDSVCITRRDCLLHFPSAGDRTVAVLRSRGPGTRWEPFCQSQVSQFSLCGHSFTQ